MKRPDTANIFRLAAATAWRVCFLVFLLLSTGLGVARADTANFEDLTFKPCLGTQALSGIPINNLAQDSQGYMWFTTQKGVVKYDGFHVTVYRSLATDDSGLADEWTNALHVDAHGNLWVGSMKGLHRYDKTVDRFVRYAPEGADITGPDLVINSIVDDGTGGLWVGTAGSLQHLDILTGKFTVMRHDPKDSRSIGFARIGRLALDGSGNLWVGGNGIDRLVRGNSAFEHLRPSDQEQFVGPLVEVKQILIDRRNTLWVLAPSGIETWDLSANRPKPVRVESIGNIPAAQISAFLEDGSGDFWISTWSMGLLHWNRSTDTFRRYQHDPGNPYSVADGSMKLFIDHTGTLWLNTADHGLQHADLMSGGFTRIVPPRSGMVSSSAPRIIKVIGAPQGKLWIVSRGAGLLLFDPKTGEYTDILSGPLKQHHIAPYDLYAIAMDKGRKLWIVSSKRLTEYDLVSHRITDHLPNRRNVIPERVASIVVDHSGKIWLGSYSDGLFRYDPETGKLERFYHDARDPDSIADNSIWSMMEDHQGFIWIGGISGLSRCDPASGKFVLYRNNPGDGESLAKGNVTALFEDSSHTLWIGNDAGLSRMGRRPDGTIQFRLYSTADHVDAILEDKKGLLWISMEDGIYSFDRGKQILQNHSSESNDIVRGGYFVNSAYASPDSMLYFGNVDGLTAFQPEEIRRNTSPPPVVITDFQVSNQFVHGTVGPPGFARTGEHSVSLGHNVRIFSVGFAALHFAAPEQNQYAYRLDGFDKEWITTTAENRLTTYTNLDPGHYVFRVKASNKDGVWNETGDSMNITITPAFWQTNWFRITLAFVLICVAAIAYRSRTRSLLRQQDVLASHVAERTAALRDSNVALAEANRRLGERQSELTRFLAVASHDLRQPVQALNLYLGTMVTMNVDGPMRSLLAKVQHCTTVLDDMFTALLDLSRLDARIVKPSMEVFPISLLLTRLTLEFAPRAEAKGLDFLVQSSSLSVQSDPSLVGRILQNFIANALQYTKHGSISVNCIRHGSKLRVSIGDTGIGISQAQQRRVFDEFFQLNHASHNNTNGLGLGLAIVKRLCALLELPLGLESTVGQGSIFSIDLPLADDVDQSLRPAPAAVTRETILVGKFVLTIDDDEQICDAMRVLLESWACSAATAGSMEGAMAELHAIGKPPDIVICDYHLNSETGSEVIEQIRITFGRDIPAILITGNAATQLAGDTLIGDVAILYKPVAPDLLQDALIAQLVAHCASQ